MPALPAPRAAMVARRQRLSFLGAGRRPPAGLRGAGAGGAARAADGGARRRERLRMVARRQARSRILSRDGAPPPPVATAPARCRRATRLWVQPRPTPAAARRSTPPDQYVDSFSWSPDGREIAYAFAPMTGSWRRTPRGSSRCRRPAARRGRSSIARGMNVSPQFSPDGRQLVVRHDQRRAPGSSRRAAWPSRRAAAATAAHPRLSDERRVDGRDRSGRADSQSLFVTMNEGTFATGAQMFEMPIVRVDARRRQGRAARRRARTVDYSMSLSRDGRTLAYRAVEARTMGDLVVLDVGERADRDSSPPSTPSSRRCALGDLEADLLEIVRRHGDLGPAADAARLRRPSRGCRCSSIATAGPIGGVTLGHLPAVHARARADRSVSDRGVGERRLRGAVPDAARRLGLRRSGPPDDHQRLGRARLQGHHGRRRSPDRARHRRSPIASA